VTFLATEQHPTGAKIGIYVATEAQGCPNPSPPDRNAAPCLLLNMERPLAYCQIQAAILFWRPELLESVFLKPVINATLGKINVMDENRSVQLV
jgi:hypothetical protein